MASKKKSFLPGVLDRGAARIYEAIGNGIFGKMFSGDGIERALMRDSAVGRFWQNQARMGKLRRRVSAAMEKSLILRGTGAIRTFFFSTSLFVYGIFFLLFACFSVAFYFLVEALGGTLPNAAGVPVLGAVLLIISVPLLFSRASLGQAMEKSAVISHLLYGLLGLPEKALSGSQEETNGKNLRGWMFFLLSLLAVGCGLISCFFGPSVMVGSMVAFVLLFLLLSNPEAAVLLTVFFLPFTLLFLSVTGQTVFFLFLPAAVGNFSYLIKALCGKRQIDLSPFDLGVALFAVFVFAGGIFATGGREAFGDGLINTGLILFYFPVCNLMRYQKWRMRCIHVLTASGGVVSLLFCVGFLIPRIAPSATTFIPANVLFTAAENMVSHSEWMIVFFAMLFPLLAIAAEKQRRILSGFGLLCAICVSAFLLLSLEEGTCWIFVVAEIVIFLLLLSHHTPVVFLLSALPIWALTALLFPGSKLQEFISTSRLFSDQGAQAGKIIRQGAARLLFANPLGGVGAGSYSFRTQYPLYAAEGYADATNAHSLYLGIGVAGGIVALLLFAILLLLLFRLTFHFTRRCRIPETRRAALLLLSGILGVLLIGFTVDIWSNRALLAMSWLLIGLLRGLAAREEEKAVMRRSERMITPKEADLVLDRYIDERNRQNRL